MGWHMRSIDFVMAYTQADVKTDIFMLAAGGHNNQRCRSYKAPAQTSEEPVRPEGWPSDLA